MKPITTLGSWHRAAFEHGLHFIVAISFVASLSLMLAFGQPDSVGLYQRLLYLLFAVWVLGVGGVCSIVLFFPTSDRSPLRRSEGES